MSKWKAGLGSKATYKALMKIFVDAGRVDCAQIVVDILKEGAETSNRPAQAVPSSGTN